MRDDAVVARNDQIGSVSLDRFAQAFARREVFVNECPIQRPHPMDRMIRHRHGADREPHVMMRVGEASDIQPPQRMREQDAMRHDWVAIEERVSVLPTS